jgi:hypothetical protein
MKLYFRSLLLCSVAFTVMGFILLSCDSEELARGGIIATDIPLNIIYFDPVQVNKSQKRSFLIFNINNSYVHDIIELNLPVLDLKIMDDKNKAFSIVSAPQVPFVLKGGVENKERITVQFLPMRSGIFEGRIRINADAENVDRKENFYILLRHHLK